MKINVLSLFFWGVFFISQQGQQGPAFAQSLDLGSGSNADAPIEISAREALEWHRNDSQYIARGEAVVTQGETSIRADILTADYRDGEKGLGSQIWQITAEGNVMIRSGDQTATGDKAVYNIDTGKAVMTGSALTFTAPDQIVRANDTFEYDTNTGRVTATGNASVEQGDDRIEARSISAFFKETDDGERVLDRAEATGNVVITTPTEKAYGDKGVYTAANETAILRGNVVITRGPNKLEGERTEVNLKTNISKIFGGSDKGTPPQRVKGIFFPESEQENR